ncbi:MAG: hypothetical protein R3B06_03985 [Kofleriaceae bacterium]
MIARARRSARVASGVAEAHQGRGRARPRGRAYNVYVARGTGSAPTIFSGVGRDEPAPRAEVRTFFFELGLSALFRCAGRADA